MSIIPADSPPVVIIPVDSKNASWKFTSYANVMYTAVDDAINGKSAIMIIVEAVISFLPVGLAQNVIFY